MNFPELFFVCLQVEQYRNVIFHGPEGSLQDYIAYQIAACIKVLTQSISSKLVQKLGFSQFHQVYTFSTQQKQVSAGSTCEIVKVEVDAGFSKEQLAELFISSGKIISAGLILVVCKKNCTKIHENILHSGWHFFNRTYRFPGAWGKMIRV